MTRLVSVVVPTRNRPDELGCALASIAGQQDCDLADIQAIVVNDGGVPVDPVVAAARETGLTVTMVNHPRRLGLPCARNTGIDHARGRFLAFLDDDDVFLPRHLVSALSALDSGADGVSTTCLVCDHRVDPTGTVTGTQVWDVDFDPYLLEAVNLFPVHTAVLRTVAPLPARFDPRLPALEDWDFWLRLTHDHGYRFSRLRTATVVYHRLPQPGSMIGAVAKGAAAMARFNAVVRAVWSQWPATTARSGRFRLYSGIMYWLALGELASGRPLNIHYYLHSVRALAHAWWHPAAESDLMDRLIQTVTGGSGDELSA